MKRSFAKNVVAYLCMQNILVVNINIHFFNISVEILKIKLIRGINVLNNI
jgi:hypothetical protein